MSLIEGIFNNYVEVRRYSEILYQGEIIEANLHNEFGDEFPREGQIHVVLDSKQTGTLYLNGSTTETLSFDNRKHAKSTALFDSLAGVTPSVELDGIMTIKVNDEQGNPVQLLVFEESTMGDFNEITNDARLDNIGIRPDWQGNLQVNSDFDVVLGDELSVETQSGMSRNYEVVDVRTMRNRGQDLYKDVFLK